MFWKEGSRQGAESGGRTRSPPRSGREGRRLFQRLRPPLGPRQHSMGLVGPASWPDGRLAGCGPRPDRGVRQLAPSAAPDPSTLPSWTHEDTSVHARGRDRSPEERRNRHITAAVMRLHSLQVCASSHAARPGCYSAPPLSHTHSRREPGEGRRLRDGEC